NTRHIYGYACAFCLVWQKNSFRQIWNLFLSKHLLGQNQVIDYWSIAAERLAPVNGGFGGDFNLKS
ncbi:MAG: hypothetical protein NXI23_25855, partial [Bacteroidetes bacterium]|nr:hypothetical protein [Bacteroidota bacterium]